MIIDLATSNEFASQSGKKNVVVVGAGTAGIYLAYCLTKAGKSVLLIDAGTRVADVGRNEVATASVGIPHTHYRLGRAFGLGGTSVLWGGQLAEFDPIDFSGWPLSFEDVYPWYRNVYKDLSVSPQSIDLYRNRLGLEPAAHHIVERFFTHWLLQPNFARLFKNAVIDHPSVPILLNGTVNGIAFEAGCATSVSVQVSDGRALEIPGSEFVFCNGTIEIVRFFLSTQINCGVPWKHNAYIGKFFQDHLSGTVAITKLIDERKFRNFFENAFINGTKIQPKLRFKPEERGTSSLGLCGMFSFRSDTQEHLANIKALIRSLRTGAQFSTFSTLLKDLEALIGVFGPVTLRFIRDRRIMAFFDRSLEFGIQCEQRPIAESQIRLGRGDHPVAGLFAIDIDWQVDGCEIEAIKAFAHHTDHYLQQNGLARLSIDERIEAGDIRLLEATNHQAGGMRMSASPRDGVVDSDCRVWGTSNVYVAGASIFPTSSHANTTFTALALAARLAQLLSSTQ
jgi:GMC oxidoreductase/NAD(P)-binding Rossmann-like domain